MALYGYKRKWGPRSYLGPDAEKRKAIVRPKVKRQRTPKQKADALEKRLYKIEARAFIAAANRVGWTCVVVNSISELRNGRRYGHRISNKLTEVHHTRGRLGPLLRDNRFWMPASKAGHRWIHVNIAEARKRGWICDKNEWNQMPK